MEQLLLLFLYNELKAEEVKWLALDGLALELVSSPDQWDFSEHQAPRLVGVHKALVFTASYMPSQNSEFYSKFERHVPLPPVIA